MNFIENWKIGARLGLAFALVLLCSVTVAFISVSRLSDLKLANARLLEIDWTASSAAATLDVRTRANARKTMELLLSDDAEAVNRIKAEMDANKKVVTQSVQTLESLTEGAEGKALIAQIKEARGRYVQSFVQVQKLVEAGQKEEATRMLKSETLPLLDSLQQPISAINDLQGQSAQGAGQRVADQIQSASRMVMLLSGVALALGAVLAWWITRSITRPIGEAVEVARAVADGDLSMALDTRRKDECGDLLQALQSMNENLSGIVQQVRSGADSVATATGQIATGNMDLSGRTEEQASALEQTSASLQELALNVRQNNDSGKSANQLAESAHEVATKGGTVVQQVVQTMEGINTSSRRIADIIGVIDGIAFQTNILALNAAVEAARAGEQGRGFAVVAGEVRALAQRSAEAAKEIKHLIQDSVSKVADGCQLVEQAGHNMEDIVEHVRRLAQLMSEVTAASQGQTQSIEQINETMGQMDQVTQQNAALVEEAAAAAQSLQHQAQGLVRSVSVFRLRAA